MGRCGRHGEVADPRKRAPVLRDTVANFVSLWSNRKSVVTEIRQKKKTGVGAKSPQPRFKPAISSATLFITTRRASASQNSSCGRTMRRFHFISVFFHTGQAKPIILRAAETSAGETEPPKLYIIFQFSSTVQNVTLFVTGLKDGPRGTDGQQPNRRDKDEAVSIKEDYTEMGSTSTETERLPGDSIQMGSIILPAPQMSSSAGRFTMKPLL